ncbi:hypothetical protein [Leifsonia sp. Leaf264]|uniref:hypothetical protein n=1 Tax=Leifsonia sp. Leaf264 TaxID=1736314 RepID=UPI0006F32D52|nr:hypothetical protein [Leifsonia sp. Leaf264]KQO98665.1 hypothetical protein ASF30_11425 [Leifsonia sp. Leaf264]
MTQTSDYDAQNNVVRNPNGDGTFHEHTRDLGGVTLELKKYRTGSITAQDFSELAAAARDRLGIAVSVFGREDVIGVAGDYTSTPSEAEKVWEQFRDGSATRTMVDMMTEAGNEAVADGIRELRESLTTGTLTDEDDRWVPGTLDFTTESMTAADFAEAARQDRLLNGEVVVFFQRADFDSHLADAGLSNVDADDAWAKFRSNGGNGAVEDAMVYAGSDSLPVLISDIAGSLR